MTKPFGGAVDFAWAMVSSLRNAAVRRVPSGLRPPMLVIPLLLSGISACGSNSLSLGTPTISNPSVSTTSASISAPLSNAVVTIPVHFAVTNTNTSEVACSSDGLGYSISGAVTGPSSLLVRTAQSPAATLYLHGLGFAGWYWNLTVASGSGYTDTLGALGHVSVTIDRLGHGASPLADGNSTCLGAQADMAHQIVLQLKAGTYTRDDGHSPIAFGKVALAGHSAGGAAAEAEAYALGDIDALVVMNWTDQGTSALALLTLAESETQCLSSSTGYASFGQTDADFVAAMFHDADPIVEAAAVVRRDQDPCGDLSSVATAIVANNLGIGTIKVPVLLICSDSDALFPSALCSLQQDRYLSAPSVSLLQPTDTGHAAMLEVSGAQTQVQISDWLTTQGF